MSPEVCRKRRGITPLWWLFRALCDGKNRFHHAAAREYAFPVRSHGASCSRGRFFPRRRVMSARLLHTKLGRATKPGQFQHPVRCPTRPELPHVFLLYLPTPHMGFFPAQRHTDIRPSLTTEEIHSPSITPWYGQLSHSAQSLTVRRAETPRDFLHPAPRVADRW